VVFVTLEDETGCLNLVVWQRVMERQRRVLLDSRLMAVRGRVQRKDEVLHIIAGSLEDHSNLLAELRSMSRDFH
jgi:error-prone DNA polymerase